MYGTFVAEARRSRGLTQAQLAAVSGVEQANISAIERGRRVPSALTLHRLIHACGYELTASAGERSIGCPPPGVDELLDGPVGSRAGGPAIVGPTTPIATRVKVLNAVLDAAEAVVRNR